MKLRLGAEERLTLRLALFGPRPFALFDRLWLVAISMVVCFLIGLSIHQGQLFRDNGVRRACASYGADEVAFDRNLQLLDRFDIHDDSYQSLQQARDQKRVLRDELHCAPYPSPPSVAKIHGGA